MKSPVLKLEELTWKQLDSLDREKSIFFVIISPIEEHGPHLPLGVDYFTAQQMARAVAGDFKKLRPEWSVLLCPGIPLGTQCVDFTGTVSIRGEVLREVTIDFISSIAKYGFKYFIIVTGHMAPKHGMILNEAAQIIANRYNVKAISPVAGLVPRLRNPQPGKPLLPGMPRSLQEVEETKTDIHAGKRETSLMLFQKPRLVYKGYKDLPPAILDDPVNITRASVMEASHGLGYLGRPAEASAGYGRDIFKGLTQLILEATLDMVEKD
jgi:creatinine amidohydrolase